MYADGILCSVKSQDVISYYQFVPSHAMVLLFSERWQYQWIHVLATYLVVFGTHLENGGQNRHTKSLRLQNTKIMLHIRKQLGPRVAGRLHICY
jgi:hypothetical protein